VSARGIESLERSVRSVRVCEGDEGKERFTACWEKAQAHFAAVTKEDDGRPDYSERKACNLITEIIQGCGRHLFNGCYVEEDVENFLDKAVETTHNTAEEFADAWDPQKCPVVKDFIERNRQKTSEKNGSEMKTISVFALVTISFLMALN